MKIYVIKATFEKVQNKRIDEFGETWYDERTLFIAYSDGTWERIKITGFNIKRGLSLGFEGDTEEVKNMRRHHRLENYIQPCNMVKTKMEKTKVHEYIKTKEENWKKY